MDDRAQLKLIASINCLCAAVSAAIVYHAFRDWPVRYAHHTLSPSVTVFFVAFVALTAVGAMATGAYAQTRRREWLQFAVAPGAVLMLGLILGLLKAMTSGDF